MAKRCGATLTKDREGWDFIKCYCGWKSPPMPDVETAADAYGDHRAAKAVTVAARAIRQALVKIDPTYSDEPGGER